tara:strand:- start:927 stop:2135 length:1209 start_codon:yes stop_codon:yes gene_type:complete
MGFQRVVKPIFYVDMMSYLHQIGRSEFFTYDRNEVSQGTVADLLYFNTSSLNVWTGLENNNAGTFLHYKHPYFIDNDSIGYIEHQGQLFPRFDIDFVAMLNHNMEGLQLYGGCKDLDDQGYTFGASASGTAFNYDKSCNWSYGGTDAYQDHNGFSLATWDNPFRAQSIKRFFLYCSPLEYNSDQQVIGHRYLGAYAIGKSWTPPHNPNLNMTINRAFDGIKSKKTTGGHTYSDINYLGNPDWTGHNAWELWDYMFDARDIPPDTTPVDTTTQTMIIEDHKLNMGRLGRRSWKFTFDFVSEGDVFGALEQTNILPFDWGDIYPEGTETFTALGIDHPLLQEDNFFSRVWIPTLGGTIPMIVALDDTSNNPDNYAIVTIKENSFKVTPKAPNLYSFSMTLEETW